MKEQSYDKGVWGGGETRLKISPYKIIYFWVSLVKRICKNIFVMEKLFLECYEECY